MMILDGVTGEKVGDLRGLEIVTTDDGLLEVVADIERRGGVVKLVGGSTDDMAVDGFVLLVIQDAGYEDALVDLLVREGFDVIPDDGAEEE